MDSRKRRCCQASASAAHENVAKAGSEMYGVPRRGSSPKERSSYMMKDVNQEGRKHGAREEREKLNREIDAAAERCGVRAEGGTVREKVESVVKRARDQCWTDQECKEREAAKPILRRKLGITDDAVLDRLLRSGRNLARIATEYLQNHADPGRNATRGSILKGAILAHKLQEARRAGRLSLPRWSR